MEKIQKYKGSRRLSGIQKCEKGYERKTRIIGKIRRQEEPGIKYFSENFSKEEYKMTDVKDKCGDITTDKEKITDNSTRIDAG